MSSSEAAFRRILVALDAVEASRGAIEQSALLADRLRVELVGLFVEDLNLLRMAALPFTRVLGPGAVARDVDVATLERSLRAAAVQARALLEDVAARRPVRCSFQVVRGRVAREVVAVADSEDLLIIERRVLGEATPSAIAAARASVLLLGGERANDRALLVVYEPGGGARAGLVATARLAAAMGRSLVVVVTGEGPEAEGRAREAMRALAGAGVTAEVAQLPADAERLGAVVRRWPGALVAVARSGEHEVGPGVDLEALIRPGRFSVLVLR